MARANKIYNPPPSSFFDKIYVECMTSFFFLLNYDSLFYCLWQVEIKSTGLNKLQLLSQIICDKIINIQWSFLLLIKSDLTIIVKNGKHDFCLKLKGIHLYVGYLNIKETPQKHHCCYFHYTKKNALCNFC